jgi:putative transposase
MLPLTLQFFIAMIACAINERQQRALEYKTEEVLVLKDILKAITGKNRIDFTEGQRRRLAVAGKGLTAKEREELCELVKPKTILEWFRRIFSEKYDSSQSRRKRGRPPKPKEIRDLVIKIAENNLSWGYSKIRDAVNVGLQIDICRTTVATILHEAGIVPAPEREKRRTWKQFMRSHWHCLYACDFFNVEILGIFGAVRCSVFFVMALQTRTVEIAGIRVNPDGEWMKQVARNLTDPVDGFLRDAKYLIHDADPLFTDAFKAILKPPDFADGEGVASVKIPPRSPNCNPHAERFVRSIKFECLRHFVFFGERHLRYVINQYMSHYHEERFHQGIGGQLIRPTFANGNALTGDEGHCVSDEASHCVGSEIKCRSRLGGLLNFYYREAA